MANFWRRVWSEWKCRTMCLVGFAGLPERAETLDCVSVSLVSVLILYGNYENRNRRNPLRPLTFAAVAQLAERRFRKA